MLKDAGKPRPLGRGAVTTDVKDLVGRLRDTDYAGPMQHLRGWSDLDRMHAEAATALEAQAAYIDDVTAEHEVAVKQLMREIEIARDMGEINYRKWAEERARAEVQAEEIKRLRQENVGASALEALGLDPSGAFREVALALKERAEAAERERDVLKAENERLRVLVERATDIFRNCSVEDGMCCCGDDMKRHPHPMECGHSPTDHGGYIADQWLKDYSALHPTQGGE